MSQPQAEPYARVSVTKPHKENRMPYNGFTYAPGMLRSQNLDLRHEKLVEDWRRRQHEAEKRRAMEALGGNQRPSSAADELRFQEERLMQEKIRLEHRRRELQQQTQMQAKKLAAEIVEENLPSPTLPRQYRGEPVAETSPSASVTPVAERSQRPRRASSSAESRDGKPPSVQDVMQDMYSFGSAGLPSDSDTSFGDFARQRSDGSMHSVGSSKDSGNSHRRSRSRSRMGSVDSIRGSRPDGLERSPSSNVNVSSSTDSIHSNGSTGATNIGERTPQMHAKPSVAKLNMDSSQVPQRTASGISGASGRSKSRVASAGRKKSDGALSRRAKEEAEVDTRRTRKYFHDKSSASGGPSDVHQHSQPQNQDSALPRFHKASSATEHKAEKAVTENSSRQTTHDNVQSHILPTTADANSAPSNNADGAGNSAGRSNVERFFAEEEERRRRRAVKKKKYRKSDAAEGKVSEPINTKPAPVPSTTKAEAVPEVDKDAWERVRLEMQEKYARWLRTQSASSREAELRESDSDRLFRSKVHQPQEPPQQANGRPRSTSTHTKAAMGQSRRGKVNVDVHADVDGDMEVPPTARRPAAASQSADNIAEQRGPYQNHPLRSSESGYVNAHAAAVLSSKYGALSVKELLRELKLRGITTLNGVFDKDDLIRELEKSDQQKADIAARQREEEEKQQLKARIIYEVTVWAKDQPVRRLLNEVNGVGPGDDQYVGRDSSMEAMSRAYKKAILKIHPDKHMNDYAKFVRATEMFKEVNARFNEYKAKSK